MKKEEEEIVTSAKCRTFFMFSFLSFFLYFFVLAAKM